MLDIDELKYALDNQLEKTDTESEIMRFCSILLTYATELCKSFAEDAQWNEEWEDKPNDTNIS